MASATETMITDTAALLEVVRFRVSRRSAHQGGRGPHPAELHAKRLAPERLAPEQVAPEQVADRRAVGRTDVVVCPWRAAIAADMPARVVLDRPWSLEQPAG